MAFGIGAGRPDRFLAQQNQALQQPNRLLSEAGAQVPVNLLQAAGGCCGAAAPDITRKLSALG